MVFTFSVLEQKNPFWVNLVKKIKIVSLSWNLVPRLIWISEIQWRCSVSVSNHKYRSWANLVQKFKIICSKWSLIQRLIRIYKIQWWFLFDMFYTENSYPFWKIWSKKSQSHVHFFVFSTRSIYFSNLFQKSKWFVEAEI